MFIVLTQWFSNLSVHQNHVESLLKQIVEFLPRVSDPVIPGSCISIWIANMFSSDVDDGGPHWEIQLNLKEVPGYDENLFGIMRKELGVEWVPLQFFHLGNRLLI